MLQRGDVLLSVGGSIIASDGTVAFRAGERVSFGHIIASKFVGDRCALVFVRDGELRTTSVSVELPKKLVEFHMYDVMPSYCIFGGMVFTPLSYPYLESEYGKKWDKKAPVKILARKPSRAHTQTRTHTQKLN